MLRMHDFPEASSHSPRREPTTTPLQQLFVLNSPWMEKQADQLFEQLRMLPDNEVRLDRVYRLLFGRSPELYEREIAARFLRPDSTEPTASALVERTELQDGHWKDFVQALLGLNEFHFVD